jgi:RNA recognition motif-containing protein
MVFCLMGFVFLNSENRRSMNIYVGNVPCDATTEEIRQLFAVHGTVSDVHLVTDRFTNKPKGFGFVVMEDERQANDAIAALNNSEFRGRILQINEARPRETGGSRGGLGGRRDKRWSR